MAARAGGPRVAFFGAMTPIAREIRWQFDRMAFPVRSLHLYDTGEREGTLTDFEGEAMVVTKPKEGEIASADIAFVCAEDDPASARYVEWAGRGESAVVDLCGVTRSRPDVPVVHCDVNPWVLDDGPRVLAAPHAIACPLLTLLHRLRSEFDVRAAEATVLRPASDFGEAGVEELQRQTVGLLSFSGIPTDVFGRQTAFNVFPASMDGRPGARLEQIARDDVLRVLPGEPLPLGLRVLQAPVFYGHAYSIRVRIEGEADEGDIADVLVEGGAVTISKGDNGRTPSDLGEEAGIWVGEIAADGREAGSFWIWAVTDAIRSGAALNAARIAERLSEIRA